MGFVIRNRKGDVFKDYQMNTDDLPPCKCGAKAERVRGLRYKRGMMSYHVRCSSCSRSIGWEYSAVVAAEEWRRMNSGGGDE